MENIEISRNVKEAYANFKDVLEQFKKEVEWRQEHDSTDINTQDKYHRVIYMIQEYIEDIDFDWKGFKHDFYDTVL